MMRPVFRVLESLDSAWEVKMKFFKGMRRWIVYGSNSARVVRTLYRSVDCQIPF
jgi:hypothetical protein